jgi:two-component sensor histidine kinase
MALIHEMLYQSKDLARIDFGAYVRSLAKQVVHSYGKRAAEVQTRIEVEEILLSVDTGIPCGLIINELLSNALKHAFPDGKGTVVVGMNRQDGQYVLRVADDGIGFPKDLDFRTTDSLGLQLVNTLTGQLEGTVELVNNGRGTEFRIPFPVSSS